jgi:hypothetical protein
MNSCEYEKNKKLIENTIKYDCDTLESYLTHIGMSETNLSKSLRSELNNFASYIKYREENFTYAEQQEFYFIENKVISNEQNNHNNMKFVKSSLQNLNLKLKIENEKLNTKQIDEYSSNTNSQEINLNFLKNKLEIITCTSQDSESQLDSLPNFIDAKNKSNELSSLNLYLQKRKQDLQFKINKYCNLPTDLKKIREMINIKKTELEKLKIKN